MTQEIKQFDAEVGKILHLMIHSLYANKEIFVRELISNASDACDKLRYLAQVDNSLLSEDTHYKIVISVDKEKRNITILDNGIGMNKEDLINNLGKIAHSGTQRFLDQLSEDQKKGNALIGQFGVGFYSSFMIAEHVTVTSKKAGDSQTYVWHSAGAGEYSIADTEREMKCGTEIVIHVKPQEEQFLDHFRLKHIIKSYSDHIMMPIYFLNEDGNQTQINSCSALWTKPKTEITSEQYQDFYKSVSHAVDSPWLIMHNKNEGIVEFTNLLFIPSSKTFDLFSPDRKRRVKLYIKRVFISDENIDLIPQYLRFVRGVVDAEDLPLNVSRETLQHNATMDKIKAAITKRTLNELKKKKEESIEEYEKFWANFGGVLKEGLCEASADSDKLLEVCIFKSSLHNKMISLDEYITNCKEGQKTIYYLSGDDPEKLKFSPQIEGFLSRNIDVLLFTDTVDDFWTNVSNKYKDYEIKSVTRVDVDLEQTTQQPKDEDGKARDVTDSQHQALLDYFKQVLGNLVKEVKISKKLTSSPACLVVEDGAMDIRMERFLIEQKQLSSASAKILELNPKHKLLEKISRDLEQNNSDNSQLVQLIFDQACIIEGEPVNDVIAFAERLNNVLQKIVL